MRDAWYEISRDHVIGINFFVENIIRVLYSSLLHPGDTAVDGGANRGIHTAPMVECVGPQGLVIAFEPVPNLAKSLEQRFAHSHNAVIVGKALGSRQGVTEFTHVTSANTRSGIKKQAGLPAEMEASIEPMSVGLTTIDAEMKRLAPTSKLRFIKLDLEGGEFHTLQGAENVMRASKPMIVLENGREKTARVYGYTKDEWFDLFDTRGYQLFDIFGQRFTEDEWFSPKQPPYTIATARPEDLQFIKTKYPHLIDALSMAYARFRSIYSRPQK